MNPCVIGIDIGGTNTVLGLVERSGNCVAEATLPTRGAEPVGQFLPRLYEHVEILLQRATDEGLTLQGIGIGAPNANFYTGTIEHPPNLAWEGVTPLAEFVRERFGVPVALTNDANAAALGEMFFGAAQGMKNFVVVTLGTGLGSGIVVDGNVLYGSDGFAGELGHVTVVQGGRQCGCGRRGCLETYASATGIRRTVAELIADRMDAETNASPLRDIPFSALTAAHIAETAKLGDALALEAFERTGDILGRALANTIAYLSPEAIILFGGLANAGELLLQPTRRAMQAHTLNIFRGKTLLLVSTLMERNAAVLGASALIWKELAA
jgi:glucokinase